ncbi:DUF4261 domain-containing protein [Paenibacillus sedimenti]|uniref:DUF4261 domain-containing protein n=1 Tax=Paenibacillus sedimenti TaxID=2770274 RepID=A0A926QJR5_9BACL|nr:DUF4261 domain-containing protein [Paenibacillus sedimenti]MBD0380983.1 DUF4261 domain-containing protein [Paenibacillus sedimenti]
MVINDDKDDLDNVFARTYGVELLFEDYPLVSADRILDSLRFYCGNVELATNKENVLLFFFKDYLISFSEGDMPAQIAIMLSSEQLEDMSRLESSFVQSWRWRDVRSTVLKCRYTVLITDFMASGLEYQKRMELFQKALYAIVESCSCKAIHFRVSEQFIEPNDYLSNQPNQPNYDIMIGLMNVRLFNIENTFSETVMDTLGLSALGLPDLQVHFNDLDVNEVANLLYTYGDYIFLNGDVIEDGNTIQGIEGKKWSCRHEVSLIHPKRVVLDIHAGDFAAGKRN